MSNLHIYLFCLTWKCKRKNPKWADRLGKKSNFFRKSSLTLIAGWRLISVMKERVGRSLGRQFLTNGLLLVILIFPLILFVLILVTSLMNSIMAHALWFITYGRYHEIQHCLIRWQTIFLLLDIVAIDLPHIHKTHPVGKR